jgi:hypothetical protein
MNNGILKEKPMSTLRTFSKLSLRMTMLAVLVISSMACTSSAQAGTPQQGANLGQANSQNPPAAPGRPLSVGRSSEEQQQTEQSQDEPRKIAAAIVAADNPSPKYVVSVGSNVGAFLAVFLDKFPNTRGQWTEPVDKIAAAKAQYLGRFVDRVNYKIGCAERDITEGCVPKDADVIITDWVTTHQPLDGLYKIYRAAYSQLPPGGWIVNLDHVSFGGSAWDPRLSAAVKGFRPSHEGPPFEHPNDRTPTLDEQLGALRAAGFDAQVVWQSFTTVLFMGRKN